MCSAETTCNENAWGEHLFIVVASWGSISINRLGSKLSPPRRNKTAETTSTQDAPPGSKNVINFCWKYIFVLVWKRFLCCPSRYGTHMSTAASSRKSSIEEFVDSFRAFFRIHERARLLNEWRDFCKLMSRKRDCTKYHVWDCEWIAARTRVARKLTALPLRWYSRTPSALCN